MIKQFQSHWMKGKTPAGMSLMELLICLSVLAIIAAVILPKFINVQEAANDTVIQATTNQLNHTYAEWKAAGGYNGNMPAANDLLYVMTHDSEDDTPMSNGYDPEDKTNYPVIGVSDGGYSNTIRAHLPSDMMQDIEDYAGDPTHKYVSMGDGKYIVIFAPGTQEFVALNSDMAKGNNGIVVGSIPGAQAMAFPAFAQPDLTAPSRINPWDGKVVYPYIAYDSSPVPKKLWVYFYTGIGELILYAQ